VVSSCRFTAGMPHSGGVEDCEPGGVQAVSCPTAAAHGTNGKPRSSGSEKQSQTVPMWHRAPPGSFARKWGGGLGVLCCGVARPIGM